MSDYRAIAGVSSSLRHLLRNRMQVPVPVTIAPPDVTVTTITGKRLNLYLYQVSENGFLKNQEIPGHGHPGDYGHPPLSLDLQYLLTAHSASEQAEDSDLEAQQILGDAMRVLHDFPIITSDLFEDDDPLKPRILDPSLVGEFEQVKITLQPTTLEEFSKIWLALPQANFRRSVAYHISVIQIEARLPRKLTLPVRERRVYAVPFRSPQIDEIYREPPFLGARMAVAESGDTLRILGSNLAGPMTRVMLGAISIDIPAPQQAQIDVIVPAALPAGIHSVQVAQDLMLKGIEGGPLVQHRGFRSNVVAALVIPRINLAPASAARGSTITVNVTPNVGATQEAELLLGDFVAPAAPRVYGSPPSATVQFPIPATMPPTSYFMRVRVDGAESRLTINPATKQYNGPNLNVT